MDYEKITKRKKHEMLQINKNIIHFIHNSKNVNNNLKNTDYLPTYS